MSMLRYFFEIGTDRTLFDGLYISKNKQFCDKLVIPNKEVREVYKLQIQEWFQPYSSEQYRAADSFLDCG